MRGVVALRHVVHKGVCSESVSDSPDPEEANVKDKQ